MRARWDGIMILIITSCMLSPVSYEQERPEAQAPDDPVLQKKIAGLIQDWESAKHEVREQASKALQEIGEPARRQLEATAQSKNPEVRNRAADILEIIAYDEKWFQEYPRLGEMVKKILSDWRNPDAEVRRQAIQELKELRGSVRKPLEKVLGSKDREIRLSAVAALQFLNEMELHTERYDVRDLLLPLNPYDGISGGTAYGYSTGLHYTTHRKEDGPVGLGNGLVGNVFSLESGAIIGSLFHRVGGRMIDSRYHVDSDFLLSLIKQWTGGRYGEKNWDEGTVIELENGALRVIQTKAMHQEVRGCLSYFRTLFMRHVQVEVRLVNLSPKLLRELTEGGSVLDDHRVSRLSQVLLPSAGGKGPEARLMASGTIKPRHGQRQVFSMANEKEYLADYLPLIQEGGMSPHFQKLITGLTLDVCPMIFDGHVTMEVQVDHTDPDPTMETFDMGIPEMGVGKDRFRNPQLTLPRSDSRRYATLCSVPDGKTFVLASSYALTTDRDQDGRVTALFITPRIIPYETKTDWRPRGYLQDEEEVELRTIDIQGAIPRGGNPPSHLHCSPTLRPVQAWETLICMTPETGCSGLDLVMLIDQLRKDIPYFQDGNSNGSIEPHPAGGLLIVRGRKELIDILEKQIKALNNQYYKPVRVYMKMLAMNDLTLNDIKRKLDGSDLTDKDIDALSDPSAGNRGVTVLADAEGQSYLGGSFVIEHDMTRSIIKGYVSLPETPLVKVDIIQKGFAAWINPHSYDRDNNKVTLRMHAEYSDFAEPLKVLEFEKGGRRKQVPEMSTFSLSVSPSSPFTVTNRRWTVAAAGTGKFVEGKPHVLMLVKAEVIQ